MRIGGMGSVWLVSLVRWICCLVDYNMMCDVCVTVYVCVCVCLAQKRMSKINSCGCVGEPFTTIAVTLTQW